MKATVLIILLAFAAVSKAEDLYVEETGENEIIPIGNVQFLIHLLSKIELLLKLQIITQSMHGYLCKTKKLMIGFQS